MEDARGEKSSVGAVDKRGGGTVELSEEDEEECEGSRLGEVCVGSDTALELGLVDSIRGAGLVLGIANGSSATVTEHDTGLDAESHDIGAEVLWMVTFDELTCPHDLYLSSTHRVVAGEKGRVGQRGGAENEERHCNGSGSA